jgi:hypothetical protein
VTAVASKGTVSEFDFQLTKEDRRPLLCVGGLLIMLKSYPRAIFHLRCANREGGGKATRGISIRGPPANIEQVKQASNQVVGHSQAVSVHPANRLVIYADKRIQGNSDTSDVIPTSKYCGV